MAGRGLGDVWEALNFKKIIWGLQIFFHKIGGGRDLFPVLITGRNDKGIVTMYKV